MFLSRLSSFRETLLIVSNQVVKCSTRCLPHLTAAFVWILESNANHGDSHPQLIRNTFSQLHSQTNLSFPPSQKEWKFGSLYALCYHSLVSILWPRHLKCFYYNRANTKTRNWKMLYQCQLPQQGDSSTWSFWKQKLYLTISCLIQINMVSCNCVIIRKDFKFFN